MTDNPYASPEQVSDTPVLKKRSGARWLTLLLGLSAIATLVALLLPSTRRVGMSSGRIQCLSNLKNIALALHVYESVYHALPPAYTVDAAGKPLHSWRTLILPYLDERGLYGKIDLSKPWNDLANAEAGTSTPSAYCCPSATLPPSFTAYLGVVGTNACFHPTAPRAFSEITDGPSETLMVFEVAKEHAVHWMAPQDASREMVLNFGNDGKLAHKGGTPVALADGTVQFLSENLDTETRRALISVAGNDRVGEF